MISLFKKRLWLLKLLLAVISFCFYLLIFNWKISCLLLITIIIHEYGHVVAGLYLGWRNLQIFLIPLFGGITVAPTSNTYREKVIFSFGGPVLGTLGAILAGILYWIFNVKEFAIASITMGIINLVNLIPFPSFDGAKIIESIVLSTQSKLHKPFFISLSAVYVSLGITLLLSHSYLFGILLIIAGVNYIYNLLSEKLKVKLIPLTQFEIIIALIGYFANVLFLLYLIKELAVAANS